MAILPASFRKRASKACSRGQGMTEYIIIVALIAIAAIAVYQFFGQTIRNQTAGIAKELAGQDSAPQRTAAATAATGAADEGTRKKGLASYENDNAR
jgi:Flp pilus assembly pilin Flp